MPISSSTNVHILDSFLRIQYGTALPASFFLCCKVWCKSDRGGTAAFVRPDPASNGQVACVASASPEAARA